MSSMPGFSSYLLSILLVMLLSCSDSSGHQSECFITPTLARPSRSEGLQLRWTSSRAGRLGVLHLYAAESSSSSRSRLTADQQAETTSGRLRNLKRLIESSWSNDTPSDKFLGSRRLGKMKRIVLNQVGSQETSSSESRENALVVDERLQSIEVMIGERRHSAPNKTAGDLVVELVLEAADMAAVTAWGSARLLSIAANQATAAAQSAPPLLFNSSQVLPRLQFQQFIQTSLFRPGGYLKTLQEFARRRKGAEEQREVTSDRVTIQDLEFAGEAGENQLRGEKWIRAISQKDWIPSTQLPGAPWKVLAQGCTALPPNLQSSGAQKRRRIVLSGKELQLRLLEQGAIDTVEAASIIMGYQRLKNISAAPDLSMLIDMEEEVRELVSSSRA
uniref:Uncharacterized protein n=2 Tax=Guillardia theta TaxID=55529 RepID=A0A6U5ZL95_GUITH|mmetsp:Transcript_2764/g.9275  ORF Transcript_2764/g.9275 Transcript_2764/m.9275 type:complete len:389 (+) Transcript_2764:243-1409(+)